jgi:hypothetical protein
MPSQIGKARAVTMITDNNSNDDIAHTPTILCNSEPGTGPGTQEGPQPVFVE